MCFLKKCQKLISSCFINCKWSYIKGWPKQLHKYVGNQRREKILNSMRELYAMKIVLISFKRGCLKAWKRHCEGVWERHCDGGTTEEISFIKLIGDCFTAFAMTAFKAASSFFLRECFSFEFCLSHNGKSNMFLFFIIINGKIIDSLL